MGDLIKIIRSTEVYSGEGQIAYYALFWTGQKLRVERLVYDGYDSNGTTPQKQNVESMLEDLL